MRRLLNTADIYGPAEPGRNISSLTLHPNSFALQDAGREIETFVATAPMPEPAQARLVQVSGASSSNGPAAPRAERGIGIDARAPCRKFPSGQG